MKDVLTIDCSQVQVYNSTSLIVDEVEFINQDNSILIRLELAGKVGEIKSLPKTLKFASFELDLKVPLPPLPEDMDVLMLQCQHMIPPIPAKGLKKLLVTDPHCELDTSQLPDSLVSLVVMGRMTPIDTLPKGLRDFAGTPYGDVLRFARLQELKELSLFDVNADELHIANTAVETLSFTRCKIGTIDQFPTTLKVLYVSGLSWRDVNPKALQEGVKAITATNFIDYNGNSVNLDYPKSLEYYNGTSLVRRT